MDDPNIEELMTCHALPRMTEKMTIRTRPAVASKAPVR